MADSTETPALPVVSPPPVDGLVQQEEHRALTLIARLMAKKKARIVTLQNRRDDMDLQIRVEREKAKFIRRLIVHIESSDQVGKAP